ncbi:DUF3618 domain-containing protein [Cellulomonas taurus]|jgi:hypothetical protein|uniref:DUF3618 domain-containing protein n=1 Tax=Cellulomonas taurus TaxID=2729175 RepID=UPI00145CD74E|nr:DUF3618 domain-containing protein [Cellulomonas taurus]
MSDDTPKLTVSDYEAEVLRSRADLAATADALAAKLDPRTQVAEAKESASRLVRDAVGSDPAADPSNRTRARTILAGGVAAVAGLVVLAIKRR